MKKHSIKLNDVVIAKIEAYRTETSNQPLGKAHGKTKIGFEKNTNHEFQIAVEVDIIVDGSFEFKIAAVGFFESDKDISDMDLESEQERFAPSIISHISLIIAFISDKMLHSPVIMPPESFVSPPGD